jgi:hypothetical protein
MTYAILGVIPHAPIEPFSYIAAHYDPSTHTEWSSIYFEDPKRFLHLNAAGRAAPTNEALLQEDFLPESLEEITGDGFALPAGKLDSWRELFLQNHPCVVCKAWKVCRGRFSKEKGETAGCSCFFFEMMRVSQIYKDRLTESEDRQVWPL